MSGGMYDLGVGGVYYDPATDILWIDTSYDHTGQVFRAGGHRYWWSKSLGGFVDEWVDGHGLVHQRAATNVRIWRTGPGGLSIPVALKGKPFPLWGRPIATATPAIAPHLGQMVACEVYAYIADGGSVDIPLLDQDGQPLFAASFPPLVVARMATTADWDVIPNTAYDHEWTDQVVAVRPGGPAESTKRTFSSSQQLHWELRRASEPITCWHLRATYNDMLGFSHSFVFHLLGEGGMGISLSPGSVEVGTDDTPGHYFVAPIWTRKRPGETAPTTSSVKARAFAQGHIDVPNDPEPTPGFVTLFLTTGANQGLINGTEFFAGFPAVICLGEAQLGSYRASGSTSVVESWGIGCGNLSADAINYSGAERSFYSIVRWDASSHWAVDIYNVGNTVAGGGADAALNRTIHVFAFGWR